MKRGNASGVVERSEAQPQILKGLKQLSPLITLISVFVLFAAGFITARHASVSSNIVLPIGLFGTESAVKSVTVDVPDAANVNRIWMKAHSPGYKFGDGDRASRGMSYGGSPKASVRINGGAWIDIDNRTATCEYPENMYECIGGAYATVRFTIPVSNVRSGANTVEFRFNGHDFVTTGWRVLAFNFLRGDDSRAIPESTFIQEDPNAWTAPLPNQGDIDAGAQLWSSARLVTVPGGSSMEAKCADCHASNGRDLKYFNYENEAIVVRSQFHGLTEKEGEQIASYIRALKNPNPGRPWNPPYQPGPGMDSRPVEEWAAGAGLDWVLENDGDMLGYIFPNGITTKAVAVDGTLNQRVIPVGIQLPDWNEWLPRTHPKDAWGSVFTTHKVFTEYNTRISNCLAGGAQNAIETCIFRAMDGWRQGKVDFYNNGTGKEGYFNGKASKEDATDFSLGLHQWFAVKSWEIMTSNKGFEEAAPTFYPDGGEKRGWWGMSRATFDVGPHISTSSMPDPYPHGSTLKNRYFSSSWYELQVVLNAGNRHQNSVDPVDWRYHYTYIGDASYFSGRLEPMRFYKAYIKTMQQSDNDYGLRPGGWWGLFVSPSRLFARERFNDRNGPFNKMDPALHGKISEVALRAHLHKLLRHDPSEFPRDNHSEGWYSSSYTPTSYPGESFIFQEYKYPDHYYRIIPLLLERGVSPALLDSVAQWGERMWPNGDWESLVPNAPPPPPPPPPGNESPSVSITQPTAGAAYDAPASIVIAAQASDADGTIAKVEFFVNGSKLSEKTSAPYEYTWSVNSAGSYTVTAKATDDGGAATTSGGVGVTISDGNSAPPPSPGDGLTYAYYEGVWDRLPDFNTLTPIRTGFVDVFDISVGNQTDNFALRFSGTLNVPTTGSYTFYTNSDDGSRLWINGTNVVDNDGKHGMLEKSGVIDLSAGQHQIVVAFFENGGGEALDVSWKGPGIAKQLIPASRLGSSDTPANAHQTISMKAGWNLVSGYVNPDQADVSELFTDVDTDIVLVKNESGSIYSPEFGINTIGDWDPLRAYMVFAERDVDLTLEGTKIDPSSNPTGLSAGWNFIGYPLEASMAVETALESIAGDLVIAKNNTGQVYSPMFGINTIGSMQAGQGYKVYLAAAASLSYTSPASKNGTSAVARESAGNAAMGPGSSTSAVFIIEGAGVSNGDRISVVAEDGQRIGQAVVADGRALITVPGDDAVTEAREGASIGENLVLQLQTSADEHPRRLESQNVRDMLTGENVSLSTLTFAADGFYHIDVDELATSFVLEQNYPNPFNPETTIRFSLPEASDVRIEVFDALGRRVAVLVDERRSAGRHEVRFVADNLPSGAYVYRVVAGTFRSQRTMMFVK